MQALDGPSVFDEGDGQPVEQLGVRRAGACESEVIGRRYQTDAEVLLPDSVDDDASRPWVIG